MVPMVYTLLMLTNFFIVGIVVSFRYNRRKLTNAVEDANARGDFLPTGVTLATKQMLMELNPIKSAEDMCAKIIPEAVSYLSNLSCI